MLVKESIKLNEVGEANVRPYDFYQVRNDEEAGDLWLEYKFRTEDKDYYVVNFIRAKEYWVVQFSLDITIRNKNLNHEIVINKGRNFRIMSTVVEIIKNFVEQKHPNKMFMAAAKSKEEDKRRLHMYLRYLEKNITSDYTFRTENYEGDQDVIIIEKINKS